MKKHRRKIIIQLQDTHGGFKLALMNPDVVLFDEDETGTLVPYTPQPTASQKYLWKIYCEDIASVMKLAGGDPVLGVHNGDIAQGDKHPTLLVSDRMTDQLTIASWNLKPWMTYKNFEGWLIAVGTEAHNFGMGSAEIQVQKELAPLYPNKRIEVMYHGLLDVQGVKIDFAHHGPHPGSRSWLKGNMARFYLRDLMMREIMKKRRPPDLVWRAHRHEFVYEAMMQEEYFSRLCLGPSYSMLNDYSVKMTQSIHELVHGLIAWEIIDGKAREPYPFLHKTDIRTEVKG